MKELYERIRKFMVGKDFTILTPKAPVVDENGKVIFSNKLERVKLGDKATKVVETEMLSPAKPTDALITMMNRQKQRLNPYSGIVDHWEYTCSFSDKLKEMNIPAQACTNLRVLVLTMVVSGKYTRDEAQAGILKSLEENDNNWLEIIHAPKSEAKVYCDRFEVMVAKAMYEHEKANDRSELDSFHYTMITYGAIEVIASGYIAHVLSLSVDYEYHLEYSTVRDIIIPAINNLDYIDWTTLPIKSVKRPAISLS